MTRLSQLMLAIIPGLAELDKIQGEDNVPVLKVHVNQVFQGAVDSIAQIDGLWLIDYANAMKIESDDEFGKLNNVGISGANPYHLQRRYHDSDQGLRCGNRPGHVLQGR